MPDYQRSILHRVDPMNIRVWNGTPHLVLTTGETRALISALEAKLVTHLEAKLSPQERRAILLTTGCRCGA